MDEPHTTKEHDRRLAELHRPPQGKRGKSGSFIAALVMQAALIALTVGIVVLAPKLTEDPAFVAQKTIYLPQRELEHQAAMAEFQQAASAPLTVEKLSTLSLLAEPLPYMPALPTQEFALFETDNPVPNAESLLRGSGLGNALEGLNAGASQVNYFGIREEAGRYMILIDTSNSMFERSRNGQPHRFDFTTIKDESVTLINSLNANTLFNVAIYEGGSMAWSSYLVPATVANKEAAAQWVRELSESPSASISSRHGDGPKLMEGGGTRLDTGLKQAFSFQPEVIFIVTDGEINRGSTKITEDEILGIIRDLQKALAEPARIHVIQYETTVAKDAEIEAMRAIASRNKGRFRKVTAKEL